MNTPHCLQYVTFEATMVLRFDDPESSLLSNLMIIIQLFSLLVSLHMHIYNKILVCDWFATCLLVKESVHDHMGVQLQASKFDFL